jgi:hypothetical protein
MLPKIAKRNFFGFACLFDRTHLIKKENTFLPVLNRKIANTGFCVEEYCIAKFAH